MLTASLKPFRIRTLLVASSLGWIGLISMGVANFFGGSFTTVLLVTMSLVLAGTAFCLVVAREVRNAPDLTEPLSTGKIARKLPDEQETCPLPGPAPRGQLMIYTLSCRLRLNHGARRQPLARRRARSKVASTL